MPIWQRSLNFIPNLMVIRVAGSQVGDVITSTTDSGKKGPMEDIFCDVSKSLSLLSVLVSSWFGICVQYSLVTELMPMSLYVTYILAYFPH